MEARYVNHLLEDYIYESDLPGLNCARWISEQVDFASNFQTIKQPYLLFGTEYAKIIQYNELDLATNSVVKAVHDLGELITKVQDCLESFLVASQLYPSIHRRLKTYFWVNVQICDKLLLMMDDPATSIQRVHYDNDDFHPNDPLEIISDLRSGAKASRETVCIEYVNHGHHNSIRLHRWQLHLQPSLQSGCVAEMHDISNIKNYETTNSSSKHLQEEIYTLCVQCLVLSDSVF